LFFFYPVQQKLSGGETLVVQRPRCFKQS